MSSHTSKLRSYTLEEVQEVYEKYREKYHQVNKKMMAIEKKCLDDVIHKQELLKLSTRVWGFLKELDLEIGRRLVK